MKVCANRGKRIDRKMLRHCHVNTPSMNCCGKYSHSPALGLTEYLGFTCRLLRVRWRLKQAARFSRSALPKSKAMELSGMGP